MVDLRNLFAFPASKLAIVGIFLGMIAGCQLTTDQSEAGRQQKIATIYTKLSRKFPQVKEITVQELQQLQQQEKTILVDVRTPEEQSISMIPGAISQTEFEQNLDHYQNYLIVVYCTIGYRSGKYAQQLLQSGLNIYNLEGSLLAWSHINGKLVNKTGFTKQIHVFSRQWQLLAEDYQPVW